MSKTLHSAYALHCRQKILATPLCTGLFYVNYRSYVYSMDLCVTNYSKQKRVGFCSICGLIHLISSIIVEFTR